MLFKTGVSTPYSVGAQGLLPGHSLLGVPAALRLPALIHAGDGAVHAQKGVIAFHRGIGAVGHHVTLIDQGPPSIGALDALGAQAGIRHLFVGAQEHGLVRGDDAQLLEPGDVLGRDNLGVLDAQAGVWVGQLPQQPLVGVQALAVGRVANGVIPNLKAGPAGLIEHVVELLVGPLAVALVAGPVVVVVQHPGAAGTQRAVARNLVGPGGEPVAVHPDAQALFEILHGAVEELLVAGPADDPHAGIDAQLEFPALVELFPSLDPLLGGTGVVDGGQTGGEEALLGQ